MADAGADQTYIQSLDWRWLNDILNSVQAECWARPLVDLVAGETMTPTQQLFAVADIANGMGTRLDPPAEWTFLNTDLAVHIHRLPRRKVGRRPLRESLRQRRSRHFPRDAVRRARPGGRDPTGSAGSPASTTGRFRLRDFTVIFTVGSS